MLDDAMRNYEKVIAKAWSDAAFKQRLVSDPKAALAELGITGLPAELEIKVVENTPSAVYLVLPPAPPGELSESELDAIAGGRLGSRVGPRQGLPLIPPGLFCMC
jgi:hypothetical protein